MRRFGFTATASFYIRSESRVVDAVNSLRVALPTLANRDCDASVSMAQWRSLWATTRPLGTYRDCLHQHRFIYKISDRTRTNPKQWPNIFKTKKYSVRTGLLAKLSSPYEILVVGQHPQITGRTHLRFNYRSLEPNKLQWLSLRNDSNDRITTKSTQCWHNNASSAVITENTVVHFQL